MLTEGYRRSASSCLTKRLLADFADADGIFCYVSYGYEVSTRAFICECLRLGKVVAVPAIRGEGIVPCIIKDLDEDVAMGPRSVPEACGEPYGVLVGGRVGMVVVPGLAFGMDGGRVGYGKGMYDAYLGGLRGQIGPEGMGAPGGMAGQGCSSGLGRSAGPKGPKVVGVCYDMQLKDEVAHDGGDVPVGYVYTDRRTVRVV